MSGLFERAHIKWILAAALLGLLLVLVACNTPAPTSVPATAELPAAATATLAPQLSPEETALALGAQALAALKAQDTVALAALAHPTQGVRFSPYAFVRDEDLVFTPAQLSGAFSDSAVHEWGAYDGSGEPINLTFADYYQEFIFDQDYTTAEAVSVNERLGQGNSLDNSHEAYPGAMVVEYHFPGFNPDYEGMDWVSLRLVFQEFEGRWVLVGIIHDQWTI